ncbi:hypothetical protein MCOR07_011848 [Pyricularia oryzae]|nr:hypothetical protein MCOR07_011848 [Pyricularia oryzae]
MDGAPFLIPALLDNSQFVNAQMDSGCECYAAMSDKCATRLRIERIPLPQARQLGTAVGRAQPMIRELAKCEMDVDGWVTPMLFYIVPGLARDVILGLPWMTHRRISLDAARKKLVVGAARGMLVNESSTRPVSTKPTVVIGNVFLAACRRAKRHDGEQMEFASTSLREMTSILQLTATYEQALPQATLPPELAKFADLFDKTKTSGLPPHRGHLDHHIRLQKDESGKTPALPWGRLYHMPREQLLELRRQIMDMMDKGWIRASSSSAAAPVLMVRKASGGWRLCVDYRALNSITMQDRYPLPLIKETIRSLTGARWFTKMDVRAAFHKLRIAEGDEHLTAFRTRFGLFEWLVCPFGLAGAPATFQRYVNGVLGDTLGDYASAYLDDILIYSSGSKSDHWSKVTRVLDKLAAAGLNLDLDKSAFAVKEVKYLGFIVKAGEGVQADPEKIKAIRDWEAPTRLRGLRGFLGFANFYRDFIDGYSILTAPLLALTKKGTPFRWTEELEGAFEALKHAFLQTPILAQWDDAKDTRMETDCSGAALGGCLSQKGTDGLWRPVAFHSAKLTDAQKNYTIHDKELLAVIACLKAWDAELRSVRRPFLILTDHKTLEYFSKPREVSERQMRWAETLSKFNYNLRFRPGRLAGVPDALSRREQDECTTPRLTTVLRPARPRTNLAPANTIPTATAAAPPPGSQVFAQAHLARLWDEALSKDDLYQIRLDAVQGDERRFPPEAETKAQVADCAVNALGALQYRGRLWLPNWEPLTTAVLQRTHESPMVGHSGRDGTFAILARDYHWDGMAEHVRRFVRNCDICRRTKPSRRARQGLLQPLPIPDRFWKQISIDFMTDLPGNGEVTPRYLMVITDRLSKYVQLEAMHSMKAEDCAARFLSSWWRFRGFPSQIISDRGSDWVGGFWTELCRQTGVEQLLSTSYHPETDGGTERANQEVQQYLRAYIAFDQGDWPDHLGAAQLALNNRNSSVTGTSPNKLLLGFDIEAVPNAAPPSKAPASSPKARATRFLEHLREGSELAQAAIAYNQQRQEAGANESRRPAERFRVGDEVFLNLRNIRTNRPCRKLDYIYGKYRVVAVPTPLTVTLDVPRGIHPTFHVELVERAASDPLPSQIRTDSRPDPELQPTEETGEPEEVWAVEAILAAKNRRGRGGGRQVLVKWQGYDNPTWEPLELMTDTRALDEFEARWGDVHTNDGPTSRRRQPTTTATQRLPTPSGPEGEEPTAAGQRRRSARLLRVSHMCISEGGGMGKTFARNRTLQGC